MAYKINGTEITQIIECKQSADSRLSEPSVNGKYFDNVYKGASRLYNQPSVLREGAKTTTAPYYIDGVALPCCKNGWRPNLLALAHSFSAPGQYRFVADKNVYVVEMQGGGGGGGHDHIQGLVHVCGGGGGGGAYAVCVLYVNVGDTVTVVVGAGGAGGASDGEDGKTGESTYLYINQVDSGFVTALTSVSGGNLGKGGNGDGLGGGAAAANQTNNQEADFIFTRAGLSGGQGGKTVGTNRNGQLGTSAPGATVITGFERDWDVSSAITNDPGYDNTSGSGGGGGAAGNGTGGMGGYGLAALGGYGHLPTGGYSGGGGGGGGGYHFYTGVTFNVVSQNGAPGGSGYCRFFY